MNPVFIGNRRELFWDDFLVNKSRTSPALKQHSPTIKEIVLEFDEPWEGDGCNYFSIFKDGNIYRMYYLAWQMLSEDYTYIQLIRLRFAMQRVKMGFIGKNQT